MTKAQTVRKMIDAARPTHEQDQRDVVRVAHAYLALHRCPICLRLTVEGFVCFHCGADGSE